MWKQRAKSCSHNCKEWSQLIFYFPYVQWTPKDLGTFAHSRVNIKKQQKAALDWRQVAIPHSTSLTTSGAGKKRQKALMWLRNMLPYWQTSLSEVEGEQEEYSQNKDQVVKLADLNTSLSLPMMSHPDIELKCRRNKVSYSLFPPVEGMHSLVLRHTSKTIFLTSTTA